MARAPVDHMIPPDHVKEGAEPILKEAQQKQEVLPDKGEGPVGQLKKNLSVYAQVFGECMKQAAKIVDDSAEGLDKPLTDAEFLDRQTDIATTMFEQFWSDQIAIKQSKNNTGMADVLKNFLDEQGGRGGGMSMGYPLAGGGFR